MHTIQHALQLCNIVPSWDHVLYWNPLASSIINQYTLPSVTLYSSSSKEKYPFLCLSILINCHFNGIICGGLLHQSRCPVRVIPMALTE